MREGWQVTPLGEVCDVVGGGTPSKRNPAFYKGDIPWATVRDMRNEALSKTEFHISEEAVNSSSTNIIPAKNVVIATRVGLGKICLLEKDTAINQDLRGIIPKSKNIDVRFLFRWFQSIAKQIEEEGTGATVKGVRLPFIKSLQLPLPPLPEQKRIVAILDEAFAGIDTAVANTEKNLANARELFDEFVNAALKDSSREWTTLGGLSERMEYGSSAKSVSDGLVPVLRMGNIASGRFTWSDLKYSNNPSEIEKYKLEYNDVLFNRTNSPELVGKTAIYKGEKEAIFAGYLIRIRRKKALLDPDFLCYFLNSSIAMSHGRSVMSSSVNQANINATKLKAYPIPRLTLEEQRDLVEDFEELSSETQRLESVYQQKLTALAELKQSLLQKAFSGELTANDKEVPNPSLKEEEVT